MFKILSIAQCQQIAGGRITTFPPDRPPSFATSRINDPSKYYGLHFFADRVETPSGQLIHSGNTGSFSYEGICFSVSNRIVHSSFFENTTYHMTDYSAVGC